jgi:hypothetical protein
VFSSVRPVDSAHAMPPKQTNNRWFVKRDTKSVLVFVHGIFSDSRGCWLNTESSNALEGYWPELVSRDPRFDSFSIFLGGFFTSLDAASYDSGACAAELFSALKRPDPSGECVLDYSEIVFVCHSTGGIVVRKMLVEETPDFAQKTVGLVLIASPSYGAKAASYLKLLSRLYNQRLGRELEWRNWALKDLDHQFKRLKQERRIQRLVGIEAVENHFIFHRRFLPSHFVLVPEETAAAYFGPPVLLRDTDHFSSVKPNSPDHPAHELLVDFCTVDRRSYLRDSSPDQAHDLSSLRTGNPLSDRGCTVDINTVANPRSWTSYGEVRFFITNSTSRKMIVAAVKLECVQVRTLDRTMGTTTAGPIDEYILFAKLASNTKEVDILPRPHELQPSATEAFFLKVSAEEGFLYQLRLVVKLLHPGDPEQYAFSKPFTLEFPVHTVDGLLRLAESLEKTQDIP